MHEIRGFTIMPGERTFIEMPTGSSNMCATANADGLGITVWCMCPVVKLSESVAQMQMTFVAYQSYVELEDTAKLAAYLNSVELPTAFGPQLYHVFEEC